MRITLYLIGLGLVLLIGFNVEAKGMQMKLGELDSLMLSNQDLDSNAQVYIEVNSKNEAKSCYCACRYPAWVCTNTTSCKKHNKECSNSNDKISQRDTPLTSSY